MGTTSFYGLPYPDPTSTVDIPRDIKALADKLELWKNGLTIPSGSIVGGGPFSSVVGGVTRPVPYATWGAAFSVVLANQAFKEITINLPTGRFTQIPVVAVTAYQVAVYYGYAGSVQSVTQTSGGVAYRDGTNVSNTITGHIIAIQTTPTSTPSAPGLVAAAEPTYVRHSICRTAGCDNYDVPIGCVDMEADVLCGPCGVLITDFD